jgi:hypothetical protein
VNPLAPPCPEILDLVALTKPGPCLPRTVELGTYIKERGGTPFLHASADNTDAIRPYESIGFTLRRCTNFGMVRTPGPQPEETA